MTGSLCTTRGRSLAGRREFRIDIVVAVEPWSTDHLADEIGNPVARIDYASSTALCTPGSLGQPGAYGLGTQGGPAKRIALLTEAGFTDAAVAVDTGFNLVLAATRPAR